MNTRVYVLLEVKSGKSDQVARTLRGKPGVQVADVLESPPDVIVMVEASERRKLAELTVRALGSVETMTEGMQLLLTRDKSEVHSLAKPLVSKQHGRKVLV